MAANSQKTDGGTPNGSLKSSQVQSNPFLTTLPGRGNGQTLVTMGAHQIRAQLRCDQSHNALASIGDEPESLTEH